MFYSKVFQSSTRRCFSSKSIVLSERVKQALCNHEPLVALESTIITHGMPKPHNVSCAKGIEKIIESNVCLFFNNKAIFSYLLTPTILHK